ncbi:MAG: hypothetical protein HZT40_07305 [Candidatus Thiothrix singaporensis]|uniref:Uncharacterized protein n=1 Tax=Candidatus Thiothrix singaporensis TaxID=2799669 RepID=A0A7L6AQQ2_9GAMM|nr:MAG: hypothetical protein HZT40_07305 [Candidatus Thiothrix singaporensis]
MPGFLKHSGGLEVRGGGFGCFRLFLPGLASGFNFLEDFHGVFIFAVIGGLNAIFQNLGHGFVVHEPFETRFLAGRIFFVGGFVGGFDFSGNAVFKGDFVFFFLVSAGLLSVAFASAGFASSAFLSLAANAEVATDNVSAMNNAFNFISDFLLS